MNKELARVRCDCKAQLRYVSEYLRLVEENLVKLNEENVDAVEMRLINAGIHAKRALELLERGKAQQ